LEVLLNQVFIYYFKVRAFLRNNVLGMPLFHFIASKVDPPLGLMGLIIIFTALVIVVFAAILQRLLQEAINIKSENDLTV
jgi:Protein of unknown function (DUF2975)